MTNEEYEKWLLDPPPCGGYKEVRLFDGFYVGIKPLLYHWTMHMGIIGDIDTFYDRYCYQTEELASKAMHEWDGTGEPTGWHRHPQTGRRRNNGDPSTEYVAW